MKINLYAIGSSFGSFGANAAAPTGGLFNQQKPATGFGVPTTSATGFGGLSTFTPAASKNKKKLFFMKISFFLFRSVNSDETSLKIHFDLFRSKIQTLITHYRISFECRFCLMIFFLIFK